MIGLHIACGIALIAANLVAGVWGGIAWLRNEPTVGFWYALRVAQVTVVLQAMLGLILVFTGREAVDLHYLYGALPLLVSFLAELARAGAAQQELGELDFRALPEERQHAGRDGDRPPRDGDHGRRLPGDPVPGAAGGGDDAVHLATARKKRPRVGDQRIAKLRRWLAIRRSRPRA